MSKKGQNLIEEEKIEKLFIEFDEDKDGKLNIEEVKKIMNQSGRNLTQEELKQLSKVAVSEQDLISFKEFHSICFDTPTKDLTSKQSQEPAVWKVLIAGGVAGAVSRTATSPLERLKILFQVDSMADRTIGVDVKYNTKSVSKSLFTMVEKEGFFGLFKGNGTNVIRIAPYSAVQFFSFEKYKIFLASHPILKKRNVTIENLIAGAFAGLTALISTYPLDLIRTRLTIQTTEQKYNGILHTFQCVVKEEGVKSLYKGVIVSSMGIAPYVAINFAVYDGLKRTLVKKKSISLFESLAFGGIAGAVAQTVTYPFDLLRRRMQIVGAGGTKEVYNGPLDAIKKIVKNDGWRGLYRGMVPCYLKVIPSIAISFSTYELMRRVLGIEQRKTSFGS